MLSEAQATVLEGFRSLPVALKYAGLLSLPLPATRIELGKGDEKDVQSEPRFQFTIVKYKSVTDDEMSADTSQAKD